MHRREKREHKNERPCRTLIIVGWRGGTATDSRRGCTPGN